MVLVLIVVALGPLLGYVPLRLLQPLMGVLLLLFGMRWLRKAILRSAGVIPLHDEATTFAVETAELREQARRKEARLDWLAALRSFKAVLLEGLEVAFIVIAVSAVHLSARTLSRYPLLTRFNRRSRLAKIHSRTALA
jgi:uncharacterized membrane protein